MKSTKARNEKHKFNSLALQWIEKNCCIHPDHDLKNATLYLSALTSVRAIGLLQTTRKPGEIKHTCNSNHKYFRYSPLANKTTNAAS